MMETIQIPVYVEKALSRLNAGGYEGYLVGGCVRDSLLGRSPQDWDVTTNAQPAQVQTLFQDFPLIETGLKHGTVTVLIDKQPIEITTYRQDGVYSDHRRPDQVTFSTSLEQDLARRDFTVNALAYSPKAGLVDVFGGVADLRAGLIRCVGDPDRRFQEDGLRILRALRFSSVLGFSIGAETAASLRENSLLLRQISVERCRDELTKLLCGPQAGRILETYLPVFGTILPELLPMDGFDQHNPHHCFDVWRHTVAVVEHIPPLPVLRWAALLHDIGKPQRFSLAADGVGHFYGHANHSRELAAYILHRLKMDKATCDRVLLLIAHHDTPLPRENKAIKRWLNRLSPEVFGQLLLLVRADNLGQHPAYRERQALYDNIEAAVARLLTEQACFSLADLVINGCDLISLGYQGPAIGQALDFLLNAVIEDRVDNDRQLLLNYLQTNY